MGLLAIDLGETTGYAWSDDRQVHLEQCGCWHLGRIKDPCKRFAYLAGQVELYHPSYLICEEPQIRRGRAAQMWHFGYLAVLQSWAGKHDAAFAMLNPTTLKLYATGHGEADKDALRRQAKATFNGMLSKDANEHAIDALWVLAWGIEHFRLGG